MTGRLGKFAALTWHERRLFMVAALMLPMTALALRAFPNRTLTFFEARRPRHPALARLSADRIAHMVAAAAHYGPYRATCLPQSLVLRYVLQRAGLAGELRYGIRKKDGRVDAHCWIELDGRPLIDSPDVHRLFAVLEPSAAAAQWRR